MNTPQPTWERGHMPRRFRDPGQHANTARLPRWAVLGIAMIIATFLWIDVWGVALLVRHIARLVWP